MGFIDWLTGKGSKKPLYALDEKPPVDAAPPQNIPPLREETPPAPQIVNEIIPPDADIPAGATVTKKVVIDGQEITDPAEIARIEKTMMSGFGMMGMMQQLRRGEDLPEGAHRIETSVSYSSTTNMSGEDMMQKISELKSKMPEGGHRVEYTSKKAWRNGKEVTDPDEIEKIIRESLDKSED